MTLSTTLSLLLLTSAGVLAPESPVETAQAQFESGDYGAVITTLNAALASTPQDASIHLRARSSPPSKPVHNRPLGGSLPKA